jgi:hypothetical protein
MACPAITPPCCVGCSQRQGLRKARFRPMVARLQQTSQNSPGIVKSEQQVAVVVLHSNRFRLSVAATAAVALGSAALSISPANAARVSQGTSSSIGVMVSVSNASRFNLGHLGVQDSSATGNLAGQSIKIKGAMPTARPTGMSQPEESSGAKTGAQMPATDPNTTPVVPTTPTQQVPPP